MNYTELKTAVENTVENTFSAGDFATMTDLAEQKIYNTVQLPALRKNVTGTLSQGNQYLTTPGDFLSVFNSSITLCKSVTIFSSFAIFFDMPEIPA